MFQFVCTAQAEQTDLDLAQRFQLNTADRHSVAEVDLKHQKLHFVSVDVLVSYNLDLVEELLA